MHEHRVLEGVGAAQEDASAAFVLFLNGPMAAIVLPNVELQLRSALCFHSTAPRHIAEQKLSTRSAERPHSAKLSPNRRAY